MKTILELSAAKALDYFLQSSNYSTIAFPIYFDFKDVLDFVKTKLVQKILVFALKIRVYFHQISIM
jgi:RNA-directed DNA polymerase